MDRRTSWPWKKKPSEKTTEKVVASDSVVASLDSNGSQGYQKKMKHVRISFESYTHLTELENQAKTLNDQVKILNENLSSTRSEITIKDDLVNQHARVAEEAVSGWEKAEAEALALKHQLESVTLLKLSAEDRASHLDGALKECTRQVCNLKEEHEEKLHEVVLTQTNEWNKIKLELETKIIDLDQELLRSSAENAALLRSLQEHANTLMKISEEKSQAVAEVELLKSNIRSCEREINSLNYEFHIVSKELEIRNEERNMNMKSAEVADKQNIEGAKKIAKLEMECQRLRSLVRKKLPGPAALAQMKLEVENMGWDHGETRVQRNANPHTARLPADFSVASVQQCPKDTKFFIERLLAMEEETNMLKEALTKRNNELEAARNLCAKTANKLQSFEAKTQALNQQKNSDRSNAEIIFEGSSAHILSCPSSVASISEDGVDEGPSSAESRATPLVSELSHFKRERNISKAKDSGNHLELMDDFLEMERFACLSTDSNGTPLEGSPYKRTEYDDVTLVDVGKCGDFSAEKQFDLDSSVLKLEPAIDQIALAELQSRMAVIFESDVNVDMGKILQDIKHLVQGIQDSMTSVSCVSGVTHSLGSASPQKDHPLDNTETVESGTFVIFDRKLHHSPEPIIDQKFAGAVYQIHDFVKSLGKEVSAIQDEAPDGHGFGHRIDQFSNSVDKVLCGNMSVDDFVLDLSCVLAKACELSINMLGCKNNESEASSSVCIDKVTLLENEQDDPFRKRFPLICANVSHSMSDLEILQERYVSLGYEVRDTSWKCMLEELDHLKSEKDNMEMDLARCTENLESTKFQLQQTEQLLTELKSQLAYCQKSNSLTETQLKCMAESYKSLEVREQDLEAEVNLLRGETQVLHNELQEEKRNYQGALDKYKDLHEQMQRRIASCSICSRGTATNVDIKSNQERGIISAQEKLAECQETIFFLDRQLKTLRPPIELMRSPNSEMYQASEASVNCCHSETDIVTSSNLTKESGKSLSDRFDSSSSWSDTEAELVLRSVVSSKIPKLTHTKSSSSSPSVMTSEKHGHGFSRFFSSKPRSVQ